MTAARLATSPRGDGWVRVIGYPRDDLDAAALDRLHGSRPVRIQHRSGALWMVNSLGIAALGLADTDHPLLADSGLPSLPELADRIRAARAAGRAVAVHCVTPEALLLLLAALDECGPPVLGDRIEHAALVPAEVIPELARRGLMVVTQPGFIADRGDDYLRGVEYLGDLYRVSSLISAGVSVRLSSDAPYGPLSPWEVMAAAMHRRTPAGRIAGAGERITRQQALRAYLGPPVRPGGQADLVLLDEAGKVRDVFIAGERRGA